MESMAHLYADGYVLGLVRAIRLYDAGEWEGPVLDRLAEKFNRAPSDVRADMNELAYATLPGRPRP